MPQLDLAEWILLFTVLIFVFIIMVFVTRWIFAIPKQLRYQAEIIFLLSKIASGETATKDDINGALNRIENP